MLGNAVQSDQPQRVVDFILEAQAETRALSMVARIDAYEAGSRVGIHLTGGR